MPYLLDSDWLIDYIGQSPGVVRRVQALATEGVGMSIISYIEIYEGAQHRIGQPAAAVLMRDLIEQIPVVPLTLNVAERCATLRATLRQQGKRVNQRAFDLLIAATALEHGLILATGNVQDFEDIPDLQTVTA
jgi:predicted nucleic acid-binding protein